MNAETTSLSLSHCLPLLAQAALLSTWIILVLRRRADPTAAAAAAAASVLLQVSRWYCRNVDFIEFYVVWNSRRAATSPLTQALVVGVWLSTLTECFVPFTTRLLCVCYAHSHVEGVDRELYELTISKVETSADSSSSHMEDTLNRLMSSAETTSTSVRSGVTSAHFACFILFFIVFLKRSDTWHKPQRHTQASLTVLIMQHLLVFLVFLHHGVRKPQQDGELSSEAARLISGLPDLSFMRAKVLMFPSVLVPKE